MSDNDRKMVDTPERDPDTMLITLTTQLAEAALVQGYREQEAEDAAEEALLETWDEGLTPRQWLAAAGKLMRREVGPWVEVDTTDCRGVCDAGDGRTNAATDAPAPARTGAAGR